MNRTASNSNVEGTKERSKLLTNWSNNEPNNTIRLRDFQEHQITKEPRNFVARARTFIWPFQSKVQGWNILTCVLQTLQCSLSRPKHWHEPIAKFAVKTAEIWKQDLLAAQPQWAHFYSIVWGPGSDRSAGVKYLDPCPPNTSTQACCCCVVWLNSWNMETRPSFSPGPSTL